MCIWSACSERCLILFIFYIRLGAFRYCGAFQFDIAKGECQLGMPRTDQGRLFRPDTIAEVVAGMRVSGGGKYAAGLDAADG